MKPGVLLGLLWLFISFGVLGQAQTMQSFCYSDPNDFSNVQGVNVDTKYPIASVSKLVTSYWALSTRGPNFQYLTIVHVTPADKGEFDLHLQGSRDPYFGQEKLHYMISKLNEKGITKIRHLTFDENFLYLKDLDIERDPLKEKKINIPWFNYFINPTGPRKVLAELKKGLLDTYNYSVKHLATANVKLLPRVSFAVKDMAYVPSTRFTTTSGVRSFALRSAPLYRLLKEMNRNSNNFAAVEIFKFLGGSEKFAAFIKQKLNLGPESIEFYEGSGNRAAESPKYNQATCRALLTVFRELSKITQTHMMDIDDIVSVIGEEGLVDEGYPYSGDTTNYKGVAKTGTTEPSITLGGMFNTSPQRLYFMYSVKPASFSAAQKRAARALIGREVKKLASKFQKVMTDLNHKQLSFASFDSTQFDEIPTPTNLP